MKTRTTPLPNAAADKVSQPPISGGFFLTWHMDCANRVSSKTPIDMRISSLLFALVFTFVSASSVSAQKQASVTVKYSFKNIVDGYDHTTKTTLYVDGQSIATSTPHKESEPASLSAQIPAGKHTIRIENLALYEGNWEPHTIAGGYSIDCLYETELTIKKKARFTLIFDIDKGTDAKVKNK